MSIKIVTPIPLLIDNGQGDLALWLDAADTNDKNIVASGNDVSKWSDKSGKGNDATQATGVNQPTTNIMSKNGLNVIDFSVGDFMQFNYLVPEDDFTIFIVAKSAESATFDFLMAQSNNSDVDWALIKQDTSFYYSSFTGATIGAGTGLPKAPNSIIMGLTNNRSGSTNTFEFYKNNVSFGTVNADYPVATTTLLLGAKDIGSQNRFDGWIGEIIIYEKLLSSSERDQVYNYLNNKWFTGFAAPNDVPDLRLWLDASDSSTITESSGSVSKWLDKSGSNNNATQATGSNQPTTGTRTQNSVNVIDFDGSSDYFSIANNDVFDTDHTIFIAGKVDTTGNNVFIGRRASGIANGDVQYRTNGSGDFDILYNDSDGIKDVNVAGTTDPFLMNAYMSDSEGSFVEAFFNGSSSSSSSTLTGFNNASTSLLEVGRRSTKNLEYLDGYLAEVLVYNRRLADTEIEQVKNYLKTKWDI